MMKTNVRNIGLAVALVASSSAALGQDLMVDGKKLFGSTAVPARAVCHTLKHTGAAGEVGPSLDELKTDAGRVEKALRDGIGQMPAFPGLSDAQVKLLSAYVAKATSTPPRSEAGHRLQRRFDFMTRSTSRLPSRSLIVSRLSCSPLPFARPMSHLTLPSFQ